MPRSAGRVVVIGAGLAGVGAAWRLSRLGFDVRVLEREARAGGRAASDSVEGFRFEPAGALLSGADRELLAWMDELGLRDEMLPLRPAVPAQVFRGRLGAIDPRGLFGVAAIPGVRRLQAARLVRLPRLLARYAAQLEPDAPERAAPLDDRSLRISAGSTSERASSSAGWPPWSGRWAIRPTRAASSSCGAIRPTRRRCWGSRARRSRSSSMPQPRA